jgi:glycosyltransferase involved in cell wall biosynthesis
MQKPLVSVIIPTYNRANYLKLTIGSIMNQSFLDFESNVVDDGSPNDEAQLVCKNFEKVAYYKMKNSGGPAKPRNFGIQKAKGKYIAFVDDDDIWLPTKLEKQVAILEQNQDFGLVHGCCEIIDEKGVLQNRIIGRPGTPEVKHGDVKLRMMGNWTVMMPT